MISTNNATLLITFNRPDYTEKVIQRLREIEVPRLYVFNDGPRLGNEKDALARERIIRLIEGIDWECDVFKLYSDKNLGCGIGVSSAISWAFMTEDRLIILEDDCVPSPAFYPYCDELLERYKDDHRVWVVCGENHDFFADSFRTSDYIFSQFGFNCGWATWKRCWDKFDIDMKDLEIFNAMNCIDGAFSHPRISKTYKKMYRRLILDRSKPSFWTAQFIFQVHSHRGYFIIPKCNLVKNIGEIGDHTTKASRFLNRDTIDDFSMATHPQFVLHDQLTDLSHFNSRIKPMIDGLPIIKRIFRKVSKIVNLI